MKFFIQKMPKASLKRIYLNSKMKNMNSNLQSISKQSIEEEVNNQKQLNQTIKTFIDSQNLFQKLIQILKKPQNDRSIIDLQFMKTQFKNIQFFEELTVKHGFNDIEMQKLFKSLFYVFAQKGQTIFNQGDVGTQFFIIIKGIVSIQVPIQIITNHQNEKVLYDMREVAKLQQGKSFGEMAILFDNNIRTAKAEAIEDCVFAVLKKNFFIKILGGIERRKHFQKVNDLRNFALISDLTLHQMHILFKKIQLRKYIKNDFVFNQNDKSQLMYFIAKGTFLIVKQVALKSILYEKNMIQQFNDLTIFSKKYNIEIIQLQENQYFSAPFQENCHSFSMICQTSEGQLFVISHTDFSQKVIKNNQQFQSINEQLKEIDIILNQIMHQKIEKNENIQSRINYFKQTIQQLERQGFLDFPNIKQLQLSRDFFQDFSKQLLEDNQLQNQNNAKKATDDQKPDQIQQEHKSLLKILELSKQMKSKTIRSNVYQQNSDKFLKREIEKKKSKNYIQDVRVDYQFLQSGKNPIQSTQISTETPSSRGDNIKAYFFKPYKPIIKNFASNSIKNANSNYLVMPIFGNSKKPIKKGQQSSEILKKILKEPIQQNIIQKNQRFANVKQMMYQTRSFSSQQKLLQEKQDANISIPINLVKNFKNLFPNFISLSPKTNQFKKFIDDQENIKFLTHRNKQQYKKQKQQQFILNNQKYAEFNFVQRKKQKKQYSQITIKTTEEIEKMKKNNIIQLFQLNQPQIIKKSKFQNTSNSLKILKELLINLDDLNKKVIGIENKKLKKRQILDELKISSSKDDSHENNENFDAFLKTWKNRCISLKNQYEEISSNYTAIVTRQDAKPRMTLDQILKLINQKQNQKIVLIS